MSCDLNEMKRRQGEVFDIKRFAVHDGPGIRTTVFVKGCNMTCWWCHNPESKRSKEELFYAESKCRYCGRCVSVCPTGLHRIIEADGSRRHEIDFNKCKLCGRCVQVCPVEALRIVGSKRSAGKVIAEVLEDRHYYVTSGGGMTVSGGEPTVQIDFLEALLTLAKHEGISTVVDTNGASDWNRYERILPLTDLFLFDLKQMNEKKHKTLTGASLEKVLETLRRISSAGGKVQIRCPVIPNANAEDDEHWRRVANVAKELPGVIGVEYLPYHRLWVSKFAGLGLEIDETEKELKEISADRLEAIHSMLAESGKTVDRG
jgi:pyruvate formate lyase activating enzyme